MEGLGIAFPATKRAAETTGKEPGPVRVFWSKWERRGRPELARIELEAAAGAWLQAGTAYGARQGLRKASTASWRCAEHGYVLSCSSM